MNPDRQRREAHIRALSHPEYKRAYARAQYLVKKPNARTVKTWAQHMREFLND